VTQQLLPWQQHTSRLMQQLTQQVGVTHTADLDLLSPCHIQTVPCVLQVVLSSQL
jgi:hypothetical protein